MAYLTLSEEKIIEYGGELSDIYFNYKSPGNLRAALIAVARHVLADVPLWSARLGVPVETPPDKSTDGNAVAALIGVAFAAYHIGVANARVASGISQNEGQE
jgi:hypothetical protein